MRLIYIALVLLFSTVIQAQTFSIADSTYIFTYNEASMLRNYIERGKEIEQNLQGEIKLLRDIDLSNRIMLTTMRTKDSLYSIEVDKWKQMDIILREKLVGSNEIMNSYRTLLFNSNDLLRSEIANRKKAEVWKDVYKYGIPAVGILTLILLR